MLELFNYLMSNSLEISFDNRNTIFFSFPNISLVIDFVSIDQDKDSYEEKNHLIYIKNVDKNFLKNKRIQSVIVTDYENLEFRNNASHEQPSAKSISRKLFYLLKSINKKYENAVSRYTLNYNYGYGHRGVIHPGNPNYIFEICITKVYYSDLSFFKFLIKIEMEFDSGNEVPPYFYWPFLKKSKFLIDDSQDIKILNTNTKVRRLGYFKLLAHFLLSQSRISASYINKGFEIFADNFGNNLSNYKSDKGLIRRDETIKAGISAKPYIDLAKQLEFLTLLDSVYVPGKLFKVYAILQSKYSQSRGNVFELSQFDKLFFLESILRKDFVYISWLLELILISKGPSYAHLNENFKDFLLSRFNELKDNQRFERKKRSIDSIIDRISNWEKPEVYLEHVLMPRLNWLYDFDLIDLKEDLQISLTESGEKLFKNLCYWTDINWSRVISAEDFLNKFTVHVFDDIYVFEGSNRGLDILSKNEVKRNLREYIIKSFDHFRTLAPNRVTASQGINFAKYCLYFDHHIKTEFDYIRCLLDKNEFYDLIYKYQPRYGDGYIQKKIY